MNILTVHGYIIIIWLNDDDDLKNILWQEMRKTSI